MSDIEKRKGDLKPIASTKQADLHVFRKRYSEGEFPFSVAQHPKHILAQEAAFAMQCMERWGMVAAETDGEDSAGRSKLRCLSAQEVVTRACDVAARAFEEFEKRGWRTEIPDAAAMLDEVMSRENANT
jgi:hypothetical protein